MQILTDIPNSQARRLELEARLERLDRPDRVQMLCLALDDPFPIIRHDVAEALQRELDDSLARWLEAIAKGDRPDPALSDAYGVPEDLVPVGSDRARIAACVALESSPTPDRTVGVMVDLMSSPNSDLRYHALIAMHRIGGDSPRLRSVVQETLSEEADPETVVVASQIVIRYEWAELLPDLLATRRRLRGEDRHQIHFSIGELIGVTDLTPEAIPDEERSEIVEECIRALRDERLTAAAARTLTHLQAQDAVPYLEKVLNRWFGHPILKVDAAAALLDLGHPSGEHYLMKALGHRRKDARGYALRIVGKRRLQRFLPHLVDVASSGDYHADTATLALADFGGPDALQALARLAETHPDAEIRRLATEGLHPTPDPDSFDASLS